MDKDYETNSLENFKLRCYKIAQIFDGSKYIETIVGHPHKYVEDEFDPLKNLHGYVLQSELEKNHYKCKFLCQYTEDILNEFFKEMIKVQHFKKPKECEEFLWRSSYKKGQINKKNDRVYKEYVLNTNMNDESIKEFRKIEKKFREQILSLYDIHFLKCENIFVDETSLMSNLKFLWDNMDNVEINKGYEN